MQQAVWKEAKGEREGGSRWTRCLLEKAKAAAMVVEDATRRCESKGEKGDLQCSRMRREETKLTEAICAESSGSERQGSTSRAAERVGVADKAAERRRRSARTANANETGGVL